VKLSPLFREEHILGLRADFRTVPRRGSKVRWYCKCSLEGEYQTRQSRDWKKNWGYSRAGCWGKCFGSNWEYGIGNRIKLGNEKLQNLYLSPTVIDMIKW